MLSELLAAVMTFFVMGRSPITNDTKSPIRPRRAIFPIACWLLLAVPFIWIAHRAQPADAIDAPLPFRPIVALDALAFYARQIIAPFSLAMDYGRSPQWLALSPQRFWTWIVPIAIAAAAISLSPRWRFVKFGILFFVAGLVPVLGFVPFDFQSYSTVADHYLYLSMFAISLIIAALLSVIPRPFLFAAMAICMALLAICAHIQTRFWHDSESLFRHTLSINPTSVAAAVNLGKLRADQADTFKAQGRVNEAMTRSDEAISLYKRALASSPNDADVLKNLGHMYKLQQRWPEAEIQYRAVLTLRPNDAETHVQLGVVLGNQGRITDAIEEFREALSIERDYAMARNLLDQAIRMLPQSRPANP